MSSSMKVMDLTEVTSVHMVGIGGISMSGLAHILLSQGVQVSGSDRSASPLTRRLAKEGATIYIGHEEDHVKDPDWLVYSAAISASNPERRTALERGIPQMDRAALLGKIMAGFYDSVSVAGSHGKTTTTALLSMLLEWGGLDPTILVGGELDDIGGNVKVGSGPILVTEACEYQGSFLRFPARIGIVLNIDVDHLDYFKDLADIQEVFRQFVRQLPDNGLLVMSGSDANSLSLKEEAACPVTTIQVLEGDAEEMAREMVSLGRMLDGQKKGHALLTAYDLKPGPGGCWTFRLMKNQEDLGRFQLGIPGLHNVHNALAALAVALELGLPTEQLRQLLPRFKGIHRRFEHHGQWQGAILIDDYAHHPAEISATLQAARTVLEEKNKVANPRIICVFQPHTYTRTHALLKEFGEALALADLLVITDIYAAREPDEGLVHSRDVAALVESHGTSVVYAPAYGQAAAAVAKLVKSGDMVITMGAGPVNEVIELLKSM